MTKCFANQQSGCGACCQLTAAASARRRSCRFRKSFHAKYVFMIFGTRI
jgi:hypothetical protein